MTQITTIVHKKQYVSTSWKYYHSSRTSLLVEKYDNLSLKKTTTSFNPCRSFFTVRFDGYFFTIKNYLCIGDYAANVCAIKSTQLKQGRTTRRVFFNTRTVRRYLVNDLTCAARKATFRIQKRFHNKQYPPKSKEKQPHRSDHAHFDIGFNKSNVAMHRQTFIFLLAHQTSSINRKINHKNNHNKQSKISQSKTRPKQNITNTTSNYDKMQCF